jgi:hypothetical protein
MFLPLTHSPNLPYTAPSTFAALLTAPAFTQRLAPGIHPPPQARWVYSFYASL